MSLPNEAELVEPSPRCKRSGQPLTREQHRAKMQLRRARQLQREPGFTPVANERLSAAVQTAFATLMVECAEQIANHAVSIQELQDRAVRQVSRALPPERMVFDWRNQGPTRNDNPEYRK